MLYPLDAIVSGRLSRQIRAVLGLSTLPAQEHHKTARYFECQFPTVVFLDKMQGKVDACRDTG